MANINDPIIRFETHAQVAHVRSQNVCPKFVHTYHPVIVKLSIFYNLRVG